MTLDQHVSAILQKMSEMKNYDEVKAAITKLADPSVPSKFTHDEQIKALEEKLEDLSPLSVNSTQWNCLRYALICLRAATKAEPVL